MGRLLNHAEGIPGVTPTPGIPGHVPLDLGSAQGLATVLGRRRERLDDYARIQVSPGRNTVVALARPEGHGVLVKQHRARSDDRYPAERLVHERVLPALVPGGGEIFVPRLLDSCQADRLLEFELVPGAVTLADRVTEGAGIRDELFGALGRFTGALHAGSLRAGLAAGAPTASSADERAQLADYATLSAETYAAFSPGEIRLAGLVQRDRAMTAAQQALLEAFRPRCLIHGDLRAENVLLRDGSDTRAAVVDWELARISDPAVELGYFIGNLLHRVLYAVRAPRADVDTWLAAAEPGLSTAARRVRRFWQGYLVGTADPAGRPPLLPVLVMAHAGAALLARVAGDVRVTGQATPRDLLVVGRARELLVHPLRAAGRYLDEAPRLP